jgi:hypothetical protein
MTNDTRFAYVQIYIDGTQALNLGDLVSPLTSPPTVTLLGPLRQVAGADPTAPGVGAAETFSSLIPSLDNAYLAASTLEEPVDSIDLNNYIYSMTDLSYLGFVNEQSFFQLNRSNSDSPAFDDWMAQQLSQATDPAEIAEIQSADFYVSSLASVIQVGPVWTPQNTLYLGYQLNLASHNSAFYGTNTFIMEFDIDGTRLRQVSAAPYFQRADDLFGIRQAGSQGRVTYDGRDVVHVQHPLTGGTFTLPLTADRVAGYQPLASGLNTASHHPRPSGSRFPRSGADDHKLKQPMLAGVRKLNREASFGPARTIG